MPWVTTLTIRVAPTRRWPRLIDYSPSTRITGERSMNTEGFFPERRCWIRPFLTWNGVVAGGIDRAFRLYPQDSPKQAGTSGAVIVQYACVRSGHARNCAKIFIDGAYLAVGHVLVHGPRHDLQ